MTITEHLELISKEGGLNTLLNEIARGKVDPKQIRDEYAVQFRPKAREIVERFGQGDLFVAQRQSFENWSNCIDRWKDRLTMEHVYGVFFQANLPLDERIHLFAGERLWYPSPADRRKGIEHGDYARQEWAKVNQRNGWTWGSKDEF